MNQYFIFKIKNEYLPKAIIANRKIERYAFSDIFFLDEKYLRKIKIQYLEKRLEGEEKILLEFLLNENYTRMLTQTEFEQKTKNPYTSSTAGYSSGGVTGSYGPYGSYVTGVSGIHGT